MENVLLLLLIVLPQLCGIAIGISKFKENTIRLLIVGTILVNTISTIYLGYIKYNRTVGFTIGQRIEFAIRMDNLSIFFLMLINILWLLTSFYAFSYMTKETRVKRFYLFFIATLGVTSGIAIAKNIVTLYIFYEYLTLITFPLVIHKGSKEALRSGKKYLVYSFFGATLILFGIMIILNLGINTSFRRHGFLMGSMDIDTLSYLFILLFIGFGVKVALVPFHSWLPGAMVAPTPVSALLHAVAVVKSGIFAIIRLIYYVFGDRLVRYFDNTNIVITLILMSILMGSFIALHQDNLKKRLAYSTISQLGYIILGLMMVNKTGLVGGLLHIVNHALIKICLFFCVGAITFKTGKKYIHEIRGIGKQMPVTMGCFAIASISLIGIPPTNGFVSKWYLATGGLAENKLLFVIILLVSAFLTSAYLLPIIITSFFPGNKEEYEKDEAPTLMLTPIVIITISIIILGIFPNFLLSLLENIAINLV